MRVRGSLSAFFSDGSGLFLADCSKPRSSSRSLRSLGSDDKQSRALDPGCSSPFGHFGTTVCRSGPGRLRRRPRAPSAPRGPGPRPLSSPSSSPAPGGVSAKSGQDAAGSGETNTGEE
uniref:Uncharacterized protein n=1 Tax=Sus scrofa TaxID=9823 RepID=A0A480FEV4_PIG